MKNVFNKLIVVIICIIITGVGGSLGVKAAVGVGGWDALSLSISKVINIKVGTFSMILNITCVFIQLVLLRKKFKINHMIQIFVSMLLGYVVNLMVYDIFSKFTINNYFIKILLLVLSCIICAFSISVIMSINFISFPLESCCLVISKKINIKLGGIRQFVDVVSIIISLAVSFIFNESINVREGTIIAMVIFGPMLDLFMKITMPVLKNLDLIE